ncbi:peptidoglycan editing factor PgeF [Ruminiclostridium herbifermentans]|uniref:Purine nucleoside phosphorylase n=1 Tax=Ruminiclostridium herbifermentans TaxID=2488810 RepID=A0A4U7JNH3_9FIRM|nr:peptidoglycan editing factor PgeF [Ruminiclostridium herbifermentans]QNU68481.1 peptidoglycan editing factor PgeF [Ruminiclostridium herbifermentans]
MSFLSSVFSEGSENRQINENTIFNKVGDLVYLEFKNLKKYDNILTHCFTTRLGGVSEGECTSLNLSFNRKDNKENILKNYRIIADAIGVDFDKIVLSNQVHDNKIRVVHSADAGKGLVAESDIIGFDGLSTNETGIPLVTFYADCVPVLMLDPVKKAITAVHSGWKSTVKNISYEALMLMKDTYGSNFEDIQVAIGPSICKDCFEVDFDVYNCFLHKFNWCKKYTDFRAGKYHIDLQRIIKQVLVEAGVPENNVVISDICTKCNNDVFFSYRGDNGKTGSLAAIMMLK